MKSQVLTLLLLIIGTLLIQTTQQVTSSYIVLDLISTRFLI